MSDFGSLPLFMIASCSSEVGMANSRVISLLAVALLGFGHHRALGAEQSTPTTPIVLICGTGMSPHYDTIANDTSDFLVERKVKVKTADGHESTRAACLSKT